MATWILVAHRAGARILERSEIGVAPHFLAHIDHPEGRLRDSQLGTSRAGVVRDSGRHHAGVLAPEESPSARIAAVFAHDLARRLERGRLAHRYQNLIVIAEPRLLGAIRSELSAPTRRLLRRELALDLADLDDARLVARVDAILRENRSIARPL
jgi:protein required for attachment to host cells